MNSVIRAIFRQALNKSLCRRLQNAEFFGKPRLKVPIRGALQMTNLKSRIYVRRTCLARQSVKLASVLVGLNKFIRSERVI